MNPFDVVTNGKLLFSIAGTEYWSACNKVYKLSFNKGELVAEELNSNKYATLELNCNLGGTNQRVYL